MSNGRRFFTIPVILLIILVVLFYNELIALGLRLYVAVSDSPRAEILLGKYYQNSGYNNLSYANRFYQQAYGSMKDRMANASVKDKIEFGRLYECGRGVERNPTEAKRWYDDAAKDATPEQKAQIDKYQAHLTRDMKSPGSNSNQAGGKNASSNSGSNTSSGMSAPNMNCVDSEEPHFLQKFLK